MKTMLLIVIVFTIGLVLMARDANRHHGLCMSAGIVAECNSPLVRHLHPTVKISHGQEDK